MRQDLGAFENHLILAGVKRDAVIRQRVRNRSIAVPRGGLVVVIGKDGIDPELRGQTRDRFAGHRMADDEPATARDKGGCQLRDRFPDELDPPVIRAWKDVENLAIENEDAVHGPSATQGVVQRRMIEITQIATKPDQSPVNDAGGGGGSGQGHGRNADKVADCGVAALRLQFDAIENSVDLIVGDYWGFTDWRIGIQGRALLCTAMKIDY